MRVQALRLEEKLVHPLVGKLHDLVFNRRAVARANRLDLPAVHGRTVNVFANDAMGLRRSPGNVAGNLRVMVGDALGAKAEGRRINVSRLHRKARPVDRTSVETGRGAGLEPTSAQAKLLQRLAQQYRVGLAGTPGRILLLAAMNQTVQKCSGGDDDCLRAHAAAVAKTNANSSAAGFRRPARGLVGLSVLRSARRKPGAGRRL